MAEPSRDDLDLQLKSPDPALRRRALDLLAERGGPGSVAAMINLLDDGDPEVEEAAARQLVTRRGREVVARLVPLLSVEKIGLRNRARELLLRLGQDAPDLILPLLRDPDPDLRIFAAEILKGIKSPRTAKALNQALSDPDPNVRAAAALSLGARREALAVRELIGHLSDEGWVAFAAVEALAAIGDPLALEPLLAVLRNGSPLMQAKVAEALRSFDGPRVAEAALAAISAAEGITLQQLIFTLVRTAPPSLLEGLPAHLRERIAAGLREALGDPQPQAKRDALLGLALMHDEASMPAVVAQARLPQPPDIRALIEQTLFTIGRVVPLVEAARDPEPRVAHRGGGGPGPAGWRDRPGALVEALAHPAAEVRQLAVRSLGGQGDPRPLAALLLATQDPAPAVRRQAAWALGRLKQPRPSPPWPSCSTNRPAEPAGRPWTPCSPSVAPRSARRW